MMLVNAWHDFHNAFPRCTHRTQAQLGARPKHADGNFAAVGAQDLLERHLTRVGQLQDIEGHSLVSGSERRAGPAIGHTLHMYTILMMGLDGGGLFPLRFSRQLEQPHLQPILASSTAVGTHRHRKLAPHGHWLGPCSAHTAH